MGSREIPADVKRQVRKECYFGCVICGMPLFEYDHIDDFAEVQAHEANNLALLCPIHHAAKTRNQLARERVREARLAPFNSSRSRTAPYGIEAATHVAVKLGSTVACGPKLASEHIVIWINGETFLAIHHEAGSYTYSARVTSSDGKVLLVIDRGEMVIATDVWDYRYEGRSVIIRAAKGDIIFEAEITDRQFFVRRGAFVDKYEAGLLINPDGRVIFTMSGLEIGIFTGGTFDANARGAIAIKRGSCCTQDPPHGFGFVRAWAPEFEQKAADLRVKMKAGNAPAHLGLESFRPYPRPSR